MHTCCTQQYYFVAIRLEGVMSLRGERGVRKIQVEERVPWYVNSYLHLHGNIFNFVDFVGRDIGAEMNRTHISIATVVI